ncbi:MAG TPA: 5'-nucleotidase C-terminal domain-containing protein [Ignavibacteriaceae bacterium]|nr:5'-nucleotidase C-terminal domain-containing protein [Ignavibacteriaceae bacterium]
MSKFFLYFILFFTFITLNTFPQTEITILHLNDSHSTLASIGPRDQDLNGTLGGIARAASLIGYERTVDPDLLLLHAGDISIGDLFFNRYFQVPELTWMGMIGFDAMELGNHEFDLTPAALLGSLQAVFPDPAAAFPLLGANVDASAVPDLDAYIYDYTTKEVGSVKVGIFGLITPSVNVLSNPAPVVIQDDVQEIMNIAGTTAAILRSTENCDVVILLSHLGVQFDQAVASMVPGIDIIIGGHDHYKFDSPIAVPNPSGGTTWIAQAGSNYLYIGKMKIAIDAEGNISLVDYSLIPLDENVPEEPAVKAMVDGLITDIETFYGIPFFTQPFGYADAFCQEEPDNLFTLGARDTPIGNLVTDAFKSYTGTDIAIQPSGFTALPLWEGTFTLSDIFRVNGYGFNTVNTLGFQLATFTLTGEAIWAGLEFGLSQIESGSDYFIQVSGIEYKYDATKPAGERVLSVTVNGQPIDPSAVYSVTGSEVLLSILDYIGIPYSDPNILTGITEFEATSVYVTAQNNFIHPKEIGRIINVGDPLAINKIKSEGWFDSEAGAYLPDPSITGQVNFNMNIRDVNHPNSVQGVVKIKFPEAKINLTGNILECLLIENNVITLRGEGKNTGAGNYGFLITAIDGGNTGDSIKITIWDKLDGDKVIYDNLAMNELGGGYITILSSPIAKGNNETTSPQDFKLEQNYPNPFNPATTIRYSIPEESFVTLKIYDILGNEVANLVNEKRGPGNYAASFNAAEYVSGVYVYSLRAGSYTETRKMILLK